MWRKLLLLISVLALVATACGSGGSNVETGSESTASTASDSRDTSSGDSESNESDTSSGTSSDESSDSDESVSTESTTVDASDDDPFTWESPISDLLGLDTSFDSDSFAEQDREVQVLVQACMAEEGFEYVPVDYSSQFGDIFTDDGPTWGSEEFVREFGFGQATMLEENLTMFEESFEGPGEGFVDPNSDIRNAMSESEAKAYDTALYGTYPEIEFDETTGEQIDAATGEVIGDDFYLSFEPGGCYAEAGNEVYDRTDAGVDIQAFYTEFEDDIDDIYTRLESDPRIVELQTGWSTCMAEQSYFFADQEEMYNELQSRMSPIENEIFGGMDTFAPGLPEGVTEEDLTTMSDEELDALFADFVPSAPEITPELRTQIDELAEYEIGLALADFECGKDLEELATDVRVEYEQRWIDENQAAITAFMESDSGG